MIHNPWKAIPNQPPFVLEIDKGYIEAFNKLNKRPEFNINTSYTPEPRLGNIDAPVVFLQLNPSYGNNKESLDEIKTRVKSLKDLQSKHINCYANAEWWGERLRGLAKDTGGYEALSTKICSIEFFPYRSKNFNHGSIRLPSQKFTFDWVRKSLKKKAIFIVTRNLPLWYAAVPELKEQIGATVFCLKNPRATYFTKNNLPDGAYEKIVARIKNS